MRIYHREETACVWALIKAVSAGGVVGDYATPSEGATVTITDPDGTEKVTDGVMGESEAGKLVYYYTIPADGVLGWWRAAVTTQDGTGDSAKYVIEAEGFEVIA